MMLPINSATLQVQAVHVKCHLSLKHTNSGILITFLGSLFSPAHADIYSHNHVYDFRQAHTHTHTHHTCHPQITTQLPIQYQPLHFGKTQRTLSATSPLQPPNQPSVTNTYADKKKKKQELWILGRGWCRGRDGGGRVGGLPQTLVKSVAVRPTAGRLNILLSMDRGNCPRVCVKERIK